METILSYILKVMIIQMAMFSVFWLINRNNRTFQFNRLFLIATLLLPFFIPFVEIPIHLGNYQINNSFYPKEISFEDDGAIINFIQSKEINSASTNWWKILIICLYSGISLMFAINMIRGYWQIKKLRRLSRFSEITPKGFLLHLIPSEILSFSFFREIFLSNQFRFRSNEREAIIAHEEYHISQGHSFDIILTEIVRMIFWFNPIIFLIQKYVRQNHEYQTDQHIGNEFHAAAYKDLLRSHQWKEFNLLLGNSISGSSINKRIQMMEKSTQTPGLYRSVITAFSAILIFFVFACQENLETSFNTDQGFQFEFTDQDLELEIQRKLETSLKNAPEDYVQSYLTKQRTHPEYLYMPSIRAVPERELDYWLKEKKHRIIKVPGGQLEYSSVFERVLTDEEIEHYYKGKNVIMPEKVTVYALIQKVDRYLLEEYNYRMNRDDEEIHDDYDKQATIGNGESDLKKFIYDRLVYPSVAKERGIEDKVILKFVVTKAGGLVYLNFDKFPNTKDEDISLEFQKAAFHAVKATEGKWNPAEKNGRYVLSWKTVPVEFKLED